MKAKISATFEGKCTICGKETTVFTAGDEDTHKTVTICKECADKLCSDSVEEVIEKYGKEDDEAFKEGIRIEKKAEAS
jgi:DNA-directed RNA polymerase subunit RPC12/RpoP